MGREMSKTKWYQKPIYLLLAVTLMLAVYLVGMAVLTPCLVNAEDGEGGPLILDTNEIRMEGRREREPVAPSFGSPGGSDILFKQPPYACSSPDMDLRFSDIYHGRLFDDFWGVTGDIGHIHWYGTTAHIYGTPCDGPTGMEFDVVFCEDAGGVPGAQVAVFSNVIPTVSYYDTFYDYTIYCFDVADLVTPVSLTEGWISIASTYSPYSCFFGWITSPAGNWNGVYQTYTGNFWCFEQNLAFALTEFTPQPPPNVKYLHSIGGLFNLTEPVGTQWHELLHIFGRQYHLSSWEDNGDGILGYCDTINMYEKPDGEPHDYHVENVTITLYLTPVEDSLLNDYRQPTYVELVGGYNLTILDNPNGTQWHQVYPNFCTTYNCSGWERIGSDLLTNIWLTNKASGQETKWHVEDVAVDIVLIPEPPPVGGEAYPVNNTPLLAPWIAAVVLLAGGISWYVLRRRRAKS